MLSYYNQLQDIIKLRKINRYLFLEANNYLTDAYNTFDDCTLDKISKKHDNNKINDKDKNKGLHETSSVKTMPKCTCYDENQNKIRTNSKFPQNYNVLEKCTCSNVPQPNPHKFRKVLSSNKTYNYTSKLSNDRQNNKSQTPCYCYKGNRCYCCFDSTDNEEVTDNGYGNIQTNPRSGVVQSDPQSSSVKDTTPLKNQQTKACECECGCFGGGKKHDKVAEETSPKKAEKPAETRGKSKCRAGCKCQMDDDEFVLFIKDQERKEGIREKDKNTARSRSDIEYEETRHGHTSKRSARSNKRNSDVERTTDAEYNSHQRRSTVPGRDFSHRDRSNSDVSLSSSRNISPEELDDINKFRDKYYFECHAIPKEQFQRRHKGRAKSQHPHKSESYKPREKECYCSCREFHDERRPYRDVQENLRSSKERGSTHCNCHFCVCKKKPYRLDDYGTRNYETDEELNRTNLPYESKKAMSRLSEEVAPNYTINIPEICFKFPINGGKIVIENQGDELKSARSMSVRNEDHDIRRHGNNYYDQDPLSISLRQEQGYQYP